jgi:hypothetical protein
MTLHLVKLAVGVGDIDALRRGREQRAAERGGSWVPTRNRPRRDADLLDGGSLYWVIKGRIQARQRLAGLRAGHDADGRPRCLILVDSELVPTVSRHCRPFQGWRYLPADAAPPDLSLATASPSAQMLAELRELGLIGTEDEWFIGG